MNSLQDLPGRPPVFLSLNPLFEIPESRVLRRTRFEHPMFTDATLAAQNALIKLGFAVKADGVDGATTRQAIQQFERAHGFIPLGEITPKLVKELTAAANSAH